MDVRRRDFLTSALRPRNVALACTGSLARADSADEVCGAELSLRPPGAREESNFVAACSGCGKCVEACPFDTLFLARTDDDEAKCVPRFHARQEPCHMCDDVPCIASCPSDALDESLAIEDAKIGLAVFVNEASCLALQGLQCEVCYRACPKPGKAIRLEQRPHAPEGGHAFFLPVVDSEQCTGCGMCERACILEKPAIRVLQGDLAQAQRREHYRFGGKEGARIGRDFTAPTQPAGIPEWEGGMDSVLREMEDWTGIEDP
jgi:ferredoxin-type protein NapG